MRGVSAFLFVLILSLPGGPAAVAQTTEPAHLYRAPSLQSVETLTATESGEVFVLEHRYSVDGVRLVLLHWPWFWTAAAVLLTVWLIRRISQLWRRRGLVAGRTYCARCFYDLKGSTSDTCPECGQPVLEARNVTTGKPTGARLAIALVAIAVLGILTPHHMGPRDERSGVVPPV